MCPSSSQPSCSYCHRLAVEFVIAVPDDEEMRMCRPCFTDRCFRMIEDGNFPSGASMDDFRKHVIEVRV